MSDDPYGIGLAMKALFLGGAAAGAAVVGLVWLVIWLL